MSLSLRTAALILLLASPVAGQDVHEVHQIGSRRELFVDGTLIDRVSGKADFRLQHPVPQEIAMEHNEPWEGSGCIYHSVFKDGDRFRMYYAGGHLNVTPKGVDAGTHGLFCCYAESEKSWISDPDGVIWEAFLTNGEATDYGNRAPLESVNAGEGQCCAPSLSPSICAPAMAEEPAKASCCGPAA